jgi:ribosomal 30S subunit maturation factor RimM
LVPYVPEIVNEVDVAAGYVVIDAPPGLLDDDAIEAR